MKGNSNCMKHANKQLAAESGSYLNDCDDSHFSDESSDLSDANFDSIFAAVVTKDAYASFSDIAAVMAAVVCKTSFTGFLMNMFDYVSNMKTINIQNIKYGLYKFHTAKLLLRLVKSCNLLSFNANTVIYY